MDLSFAQHRLFQQMARIDPLPFTPIHCHGAIDNVAVDSGVIAMHLALWSLAGYLLVSPLPTLQMVSFSLEGDLISIRQDVLPLLTRSGWSSRCLTV